jgi:hypothetical protein
MLAAMLRALFFASALFSTSALAAPTAPAGFDQAERSAQVKVAKAPKKKKGSPEKPADKAAPEGARSDPRASSSGADAAAAAPELGTRRAMSRIEFDDRLIQGQTNKANAIYLFERRESALRSLLKKRTNFHEEIDETL